MVGVLHTIRRKNEGKNLGRKHLELSERRRVFAWKKLQGKRAKRKAGGEESPPARNTRPRGRGRAWRSTFGTFNVRTAAVNGINGIGHINTLLRPCAAKGCNVIGLQETKRDGTSEIRHLDTASFLVVIVEWLRAGKGSMGLDWR